MAKTFKSLKKMVGNSSVSKFKDSKDERKSFKDLKVSDYNFSGIKSDLEKQIRLDTFVSDLSSMGQTIEDSYNGWQTQETMKNTRATMESMQDRLRAYKEYNQLFGGGKNSKDITKTIESYGKVLDGWDAMSSDYAQFKDAESYKAEKDTLKKLGSMNSSEVKKYMDDAPNIDGWLNTAKNYESKLNSNALDRYNLTSIGRLDEKMRETPNEAFNVLLNGIKTDNSDSTKKEYDEFLKGIGYSGIKDLESAKSGIAYTTASGENITWKSLYDTKKYNEEHNTLYNNISSKADFDKYTKKGASVKDPTYGEVYSISSIFNPKEVTNVVEFTFNNQDAMLADRDSNASPAAKYAYYTKISAQERSIYNYYVGRELEGKEEKGTAQKYLDSIYGKLKDRYENNMLERDIQFGEEHPGWASLYSVGQSLGSGVEWLADTINYAKTGELDTNYLAQSSSAIRSVVSDKIDWNVDFLDGWDAFDFVYNTGMSMADSAVAMGTLGMGGGVALGLSAAAQGTNDALERGLDNKSAFLSGLTSGVFEGLFETFSIGKFKTFADAPVDGVKAVIKNIGKSMLTNASEETLTELANLTYDYFANGDLSQFKTKVRAYMASGISEEEAIRKVALEQGGQVLEAGLSGALMGIGFGAISGASAFNKSYSTGKAIKANERTSDLFDLVSNPEIGAAYEAYTQYANKGINADNIKNAQLGSLYRTAKDEAVATMQDKKASGVQKVGAFQTLSKIADIDTPNTIKTEAKKNYNIGEETKVTDTGETFDIKDVKVKGEDVVVATKDGEISVDDATFTQRDAELVQHARGLAKTDGDAVAELFLNQYDGKMSPEKYATSFNLTVEYAKKDYTFEHMINNRGELTAQQVSDIYKETRIAADRARAEKIKKLNKAMADKMAYKGFVDDTVIDYNNTSAKGKVNWNSLTLQQRQAVTFVTGFAQAVGMRVKFIKDGETEGINGSYSISSNEIIIDIYAGTSEAASLIKDTIIPTMSHETTHWMRRKSPEMWRNLNEIVFKTLVDHYNSNTEQAIKDKINLLLKRDGVEYTAEEVKEMTITEEDIVKAEYRKISLKRKTTEDEAREEIIARACEDMLKKSQQGRKIFSSLSESEQKSLVEKFKAVISDLLKWVNDLLNSYDSKSTEARIMREYKEQLEKASKVWDEMLKQSVVANQSLEKSGAFKDNKVNEAQGETEPFFATSEMLNAVDEDGKSLFQYRAMEEDKDIYREMLNKNKHIIGITNKQIKDLFDMIDNAVEIISNNLEELDYSWEADINDRAFSPIKPNSDSLYKVSLDFSTLCRKRLLQQTIQQTLQEALNKNLSKEESIAIRDELMKIQEEGRKIEVACALCYVESARMKSPVQINKFLNNREAVIKEFFANRSGGSIAEKVAEAELKARKKLKKDNPNGFFGKNDVMLDPLTAPKSHMKKADADYIRAEGKKAKLAYKLTEHEQAELDAAMSMGVGEFTSAKGLENLAKNHPDIFDAYTSFVRNATHSKGIENDTWWRAGDSDAIGDNLIAQMNAENGLRSQSWSDFQVIHLLDYIAATIELSTKGAKRQSYTKVPDYVKLLGNTGDMINISLIPERVFNGKLSYDPVEGMAYDIAKKLRDEYHATVGSICIGINNEQIRMLLADGTIDMVIPYHHSSMSKAVIKLMHIPAWETYQNYQSEKKLSDTEAKAQAKKYDVKLNTDSNYQKAPKFSEWFDLAEARQIAEYENLKAKNGNPTDAEAYKKYGKMYGGYVAMQKAADRYLKLCAERGLSPKFSDEKSDFTKEANYWKLLIDRKMVDNVTGEIIEQKAIKPIFKESAVLEILNDELKRYPQIKADQEYATRKVTEKFLSGEMKVDKSTLEAIKKPIDNVAEVNILESAKDKVLNSDRDSEGNTLTKEQIEFFKDSKARDKDGNLMIVFHGSPEFFTIFDTHKDTSSIIYDASFFTSDESRAKAYADKNNTTGHMYKGYLDIKNPLMPSKVREQINFIPDSVKEKFQNEFDVDDLVSKTDYVIIDFAKFVARKENSTMATVLKSWGFDGYINGNDYAIFEPEQFKSFDNTTPTKNKDYRYSDRDDIGYHAGDLGKSESLGQQGRYRGTGHFGTGTYFVGNKELVKEYNRRDGVPAPQHAVDFSNYNLYKIKNDKDGYRLHDQLRIIDGGIHAEWVDAAKNDKFQLYRSTEYYYIAEEKFGEEGKYSNEALIYGLTELAKKADIEIPTKEQYSKESGYELDEAYFDSMYKDHLMEVVDEQLEEINDAYAEFRDAYSALEMRFGFGGKVYEAMNKVLEYQNANRRDTMDAYKKDSLATVFMKSLGYEGIDTRGTALDNTAYGSVIYDIKDDTVLYSEREEPNIYDLMGERDRLIKENEKLRQDFEGLRERLDIERKVTHGNYFNENQLGTVAGHLRNISNSNMDKVELMKALKDVYSFIAQTKELTWEDVYERCYRVAEKMLAESRPEVEVDYYSKQILRDIRNTRISLNDSQKAEAQHIFGKNWNRGFFGSVVITDKGTPIESMWQEWSEQYPNLFSEETTPNDMLSELYDIIGSLRDASETIVKYNSEEDTRWLANEIYNQYWNVSPIRTTADKYDKKIKLINFKHRQTMSELRKEYDSRVEKQKLADTIHYKKQMIELSKKLRERRDRDVARAKELGRERLVSYKENAERKTQIQRITADIMSLKELLVKNSKDKHVPDVLKGPVTTLIQAIDFSSKRLLEKGVPTQKDISLQNALRQVTDMMASTNSALEGVVDMYGIGLDSKMADMMKSVDRIVGTIGSERFTLQMMSSEELKTLATMTKVIKASVNSLNQFHVTHHNAGVLNLAFETAEEVDAAKKMHKNNKKHFDKLKTKTYWNNLNPYYAFKNLGKAAQKIFTAFQDGQDKVAFLAKEIIDFTEGLYTTKEYEKWNETFFDFEIKQPDGKIKKVSMNVPQIMSLYCVAKQQDALNHILNGVEDDKGNKGKGRGITLAETDTTEAVLTNILLTEADLKEITSKLDEVDRAKEIADELQKFMSTRGAELGNEVSMARWGIKSFGIENYFPIKVSDGSAPKKNDTPGVQGNPLLSLLNASFTHARTLNAPQSIEIGNVFDVFANHMASMIQYNAMALPVLDMYKWLNAQGVDEVGNEISLMTSIRSTFGDEAWSYFNTFLKDVNGATKSQRRDNWAIKFFKNSKIAKVAANIRVVALQFTSYIRAGSVMDNKYLLRALVHKPKIQKSEEHCGMVLWKSLGYFNTDISSPLANKIKHVESIKDKITDFSLKGAEWADKITLGYLWNACELEVRDTRKDLQVGSDEFNKEIALRLRDVIYRTQVVDSQLTRSQMMRSPETWDKMLTTFASESTLSFNLITDIYVSYKLDSRRIGKEKAKEKHGKYMRKAIIAYAVTNVATSMIASLFDAFRDYDEDDKDEEYWLKLMLGNLATDFSFINKIPYLNLFISAIQGFGASRTDAEWMEESVKAVKQLYKFMTGEGSGEKALKSVLKAASDITGVAGYNLYRDIRAFIEMFDD